MAAILHSPRALVKELASTKDDLSSVLIAVRNDVMKETQRKQVPWEHSALTGRFYFSPTGPTAPPSPVAPSRLSEPAEAWAQAKDNASIPALEAFLRRFEDTYYGDLAKVRLAELKQAEAVKEAAKKKAMTMPAPGWKVSVNASPCCNKRKKRRAPPH